MIEDIRTALDDGVAVDFDLAIIGAGPAGITLAREMSGRGLRIAQLEAGGMDPPDPEAAALYDGDVVGLSYPLAASRQRFFGGTRALLRRHEQSLGRLEPTTGPDRFRRARLGAAQRLAAGARRAGRGLSARA